MATGLGGSGVGTGVGSGGGGGGGTGVGSGVGLCVGSGVGVTTGVGLAVRVVSVPLSGDGLSNASMATCRSGVCSGVVARTDGKSSETMAVKMRRPTTPAWAKLLR